MVFPLIAAVSAITQGVQAVGSLFNGPKQPQAAENSAQAAESTSMTPAQSVKSLPKEIQEALINADAVLTGISTGALLRELAKRPEATKTSVASAPTSQASAPSADPAGAETAAGSSTDAENSAATGSPAATVASANPTNARTSLQNGKAVFQNDNYIIAAGDNNKVTIYNKKTKEVYEAVGDPSMKIDGKAGFSGKGTMSLMLNDGTKVTMGRADDGKGGTLASKLTITNGAYGAQIKGIDTNKTGDLAVQEFSGQGQALDEQVTDGVTMEENQDININNGRGFVVKDANGAATLVSKEYLAKVSNGDSKAGNLDQFDLPGGEQQAGTPSQTSATGSAQTNDPVQSTQATTPTNTAGSRAIQEQFSTNQASRQSTGCFGTGQQANTATPQQRAAGTSGQNRNPNRRVDVRTAQAVNINSRSTQPGKAMQRVGNDTVRRQPAGGYEALGQAQPSRRPDRAQRSAATQSQRPAATPISTRESVVRTTVAETNRKATTTLMKIQKPMILDVPQMPQSRIFGLNAFAGKDVPSSRPIQPIRI